MIGTTSSPEIWSIVFLSFWNDLLPRWLAGHEWSANDPDIKSFWTSTITNALTGLTA